MHEPAQKLARMSPRPWTWKSTWRATLVLGLLAGACLAGLDVRIARFLWEGPRALPDAAERMTAVLDTLTGKRVSDLLLPGTLALLALGLHRTQRGRAAAACALVALSASLPHLLVGILKRLFGRLRPRQIAESGWVECYFAGGNSLPSGHTAFYLGLCLALAWSWPRGRHALLLVAIAVGLARVLEGDHFPGDVLLSAALTLLVVRALFTWFERRGWLEFDPAPVAEFPAER